VIAGDEDLSALTEKVRAQQIPLLPANTKTNNGLTKISYLKKLIKGSITN